VTICDKHHLPLWPVEQSFGRLQCIRNPSGALFVLYVRRQSRYSNRREDAAALRALCRFEQGLKLALDGQPSGLFGLEGSAFIAVATDLIWALLQPAAGDGTRVAHHLQVDHFRVPQGWRTPYCLSTLRARHAVSPSDSRNDRLSAPSLLIRRTHHLYNLLQLAKGMRASAGTTWRRKHLRASGSRPSLAPTFPRPHGKRCSSAEAPPRQTVAVYRLAAKIY
jgi:hypothetical protein